MKRLARIRLLAAGVVFSLLLITALGFWQYEEPSGRLPTAEELKQPIMVPTSDGTGTAEVQPTMFSEEQMRAVEEGKTVTIKGPGGGYIQIGPPKGPPKTAEEGDK
jgi:hypothetical protein